MFLPPSQERSPEPAPIKTSEKTKLTRNLRNWSVYVACFSGGTILAFIPRIIPGAWVFYGIAKISIIGYLIAVKPQDATLESLSLRRLAGLAVMLSTIAGHWDGVLLFLTRPTWTGNTVLPLWIVAIAAILGVIVLIFILLVLWRMADDKSQNPFR
ncbi:MAG: hypothetical protein KME46_34105 [Brasilonema angustatum HA4187-MV1]|jgi:hypothetical protein|nr:hypothetical protein [Brasilonema angustatum HA4187-MV1]